jgi:hypothetical protein
LRPLPSHAHSSSDLTTLPLSPISAAGAKIRGHGGRRGQVRHVGIRGHPQQSI